MGVVGDDDLGRFLLSEIERARRRARQASGAAGRGDDERGARLQRARQRAAHAFLPSGRRGHNDADCFDFSSTKARILRLGLFSLTAKPPLRLLMWRAKRRSTSCAAKLQRSARPFEELKALVEKFVNGKTEAAVDGTPQIHPVADAPSVAISALPVSASRDGVRLTNADYRSARSCGDRRSGGSGCAAAAPKKNLPSRLDGTENTFLSGALTGNSVSAPTAAATVCSQKIEKPTTDWQSWVSK